MGVAKFEITRKCKICGEPFVAKTITSWYCSPRCSKVAFKRRKDEEKRNERLDAIAKAIPQDQEYITVPEAYSMFGISKETLYRQIRKGVIPSVIVQPNLDTLRQVAVILDVDIRDLLCPTK